MIYEKFGHKIEFGLGSSTGHPEFRGMQTADMKLWFRLDDGEWIRAIESSIIKNKRFLDLCDNEDELFLFFNELSDN